MSAALDALLTSLGIETSSDPFAPGEDGWSNASVQVALHPLAVLERRSAPGAHARNLAEDLGCVLDEVAFRASLVSATLAALAALRTRPGVALMRHAALWRELGRSALAAGVRLRADGERAPRQVTAPGDRSDDGILVQLSLAAMRHALAQVRDRATLGHGSTTEVPESAPCWRELTEQCRSAWRAMDDQCDALLEILPGLESLSASAAPNPHRPYRGS